MPFYRFQKIDNSFIFIQRFHFFFDFLNSLEFINITSFQKLLAWVKHEDFLIQKQLFQVRFYTRRYDFFNGFLVKGKSSKYNDFDSHQVFTLNHCKKKFRNSKAFQALNLKNFENWKSTVLS